MIVYYFVFIVTLILAYYLPAETDKEWRKKLFWTFVPLFLFGALRVNMGNDYAQYELFFEMHHGQDGFVYDETAHSEFGYQLLNYIMPSFRAVLVLNSLLLCVALAVFIYRNIPKEYLWLAIILIFLNVEKNIYGSLVGVRNGLAVTTFLLGSVFIQNRKLIPFIVTTVIAMSLHSSAVFFMPVAYIVGLSRTIDKKEIVIWAILACVILLSSQTGLMSYVEPFLVDELESYQGYLKDEYHRGFLLTTTGVILFYLIISLFWEQKDVISQEQSSLIRLGFLYPISTLLGSMAMRASYFYDMFFIATVALLYSRAGKQNVRAKLLFILALISSAYSFYLWRCNNMGNPRYDVYQSILSLF